MNMRILLIAIAIICGSNVARSQTQSEIEEGCNNLYKMQMMGIDTSAIVEGIMFTGTDERIKKLLAMRRVCPDAMQ